jgi:hypothetical protein
MKGTRNGKRALVLAAVTLLVSAGLCAQSKTRAERREEANSRAVQGLVLLPDEKPAVGAVVQLKDMRTLQIRSFITLDDGMYHFSGLRADIDYQLTAKSGDLAGAPHTLSIFDNRKDAVLNFKLEKIEKK